MLVESITVTAVSEVEWWPRQWCTLCHTSDVDVTGPLMTYVW